MNVGILDRNARMSVSTRWVALYMVIALIVTMIPQTAQIATQIAAPVQAMPDFANMSLAFVPNVGQTDSEVAFQSRTMGGSAFFTADGIVLALPIEQQHQAVANTDTPYDYATDDMATEQNVVHMNFVGANTNPTIVGDAQQTGVHNFIQGNDPAQWHTQVPAYSSIVYQDLYNGISLRYEGQAGRIKGTYTVAPNADPSRIQWGYHGANSVAHDTATGNLLVTLPATTLTEQAPIAWQTINGQRVPVEVYYTLNAQNVATTPVVGFALGTYNPAYALTIDPTIEWSTYLGGSDGNTNWDVVGDYCDDIAVDGQGNVYVTGKTSSPDFPVKDAYQTIYTGESDAFLSKFSPDGVLLYSTYLGGTGGSEGRGLDTGAAVAVDAMGNAYITGNVFSDNFPITSSALDKTLGGGRDAYVAKFSPNGQLLYSTYLGGNDWDYGFGIKVGDDGDIYVVGFTHGSFPLEHELQSFGGLGDAFVTCIKADGSGILYSTYLGGSGWEAIHTFAVVGDSVYIPWGVSSPDLTTTANAYDKICPTCNSTGKAVLTKITWHDDTQTLTLDYQTYFGGGTYGTNTGMNDIAVLPGGEYVYVVGETNDPAYPVTPDALQKTFAGGNHDAFIAKMSVPMDPTTKGTVEYSTFLGTSDDDRLYRVFYDDAKNLLHMVGSTNSANYPVVNPMQATLAGGYDMMFSTMNLSDHSLSFSSYLGGSNNEDMAFPNLAPIRAAMDANRSTLYLAGATNSTDYPTKNAYQAQKNVGYDAFVTKIQMADIVLQSAPPTTAFEKTLVWIPVDMKGVLDTDDVHGLQFTITSDAPAILAPANTESPILGGMFTADSSTYAVPTSDAWSFILNSAAAATVTEGTIVSLPFYAHSPGTATLTLSASVITDGEGGEVSHTIETGQKVEVLARGAIEGNAYLQHKGSIAGITVEALGPEGVLTTTTDAQGNFTLPDLLPGTYAITVSYKHHLSLTLDNIQVESGKTTTIDAGLWVGDLDDNDEKGDGKIDAGDLLVCHAASIPVNDPRFDLNGDGKTNVRDCQLIRNNFGKKPIPMPPRPGMLANQVMRASELAESSADSNEVLTQPSGTVTLVPQDDGTSVARVENVDDKVYAVGMRLELPDGATVTDVETLNAFAGGFLSWHQDGNMLYIIIDANDSFIDSDTDVVRISGVDTATVAASNLIGNIATSQTHRVFMPLVAR